jgi:GNAT superfamily N-acetyltransferase
MLQRAGIAEVEVLAAIMARCFRSNYTGLISEAAFEADLAIAALTERVRSYVQRKVSETWAIRDGEGFVSFGASRDADATPQVGEVYALFVEPGQQGRGQGGELLLHAQGRLAALGYREATLSRVPQVMGQFGHTPRYRPSSARVGRSETGESPGHTFDRCSNR